MLAPSSNELTRRAGELLRKPVVRRSDLELVFDESSATTAEVHVEGRNFYPPMLHDIASARSSVHVHVGRRGDALVEYELEVRAANDRGAEKSLRAIRQRVA